MMDFKDLYRVNRISDEVVLIFCTTHINPISYLSLIEEDLIRINFSGKIIFDLLLCNGYSTNRFVEASVCGSKVNRRSMRVIESSILDKSTIKNINKFYKKNRHLLENNDILLDDQKYDLINNL